MCGAVLGVPGDATVAMPAPTPSSQTGGTAVSATRVRGAKTTKNARFTPGTMMAGRYQIVGMLGQGGMGEVYRANDLTLDQAVALKFLPSQMAANPAMLARFHGEVRIARQVSHPNVCRVYDIGEVDGQLFLSMEYVDGEDLSTLLRRIGRLPAERAVEFARKICAGLAAAHEKGIIHRDLKPANLMIDSEGQVVIMDFGLAAVAEQVAGAEISAGTPAYMAPEQLSGREVTVKSDIYALGLVLYEMFTGRRPFEGNTLADMLRQQQSSTPASLTDVAKDLDPGVERVILHCLEPDPRNRPASALAVAAALPGGDPLAAALAAGETPSPELVAAAGSRSSVRPWIAIALLVFIGASLIAAAVLAPMSGMLAIAAPELPPDALEQKAREYASALGYTAKPLNSARGLEYDLDGIRYIEREVPRADQWRRAQSGVPPAVYFWYRQSPRYLEPSTSRVTPEDPPMNVSGMIFERLDGRGRLVAFTAVPPQVDDPQLSGMAVDWSVVLRSAGFDPAAVKTVESKWTPPVYADSRIAWEGVLPELPSTPVRIEAAAWRGKPVYFSVVGPWTRAARMQAFTPNRATEVLGLVFIVITVGLLIGAVLLSRYNIRRKRGDQAGANRLALFIGIVYIAIWILDGWFVPTNWTINTAFRAFAYALFFMASMWVGYVAIEPFVRRHWPQTLVSWARLLAGGVGDPLVGRDLLIGLAAGCFFALISYTSTIVEKPYGQMPNTSAFTFVLLGARHGLGLVFISLTNSIVQTLSAFFLLFLARTVLRRQWLAAPVFIAFFAVAGAWGSATPLIDGLLSLAISLLLYVVVTRVGFLALVAALYVQFLMMGTPFPAEYTGWNNGPAMLTLVVLAAMSAYAARTALAGTSIIRDDLL